MPHIRMRALSQEQAQKLSTTLVKGLSDLTKSPIDNFTLELVSTQYFTDSYPFVEVLWFSRPQEMQDQCAKFITEQIKAIDSRDVTVVFQILTATAYYENGKHF